MNFSPRPPRLRVLSPILLGTQDKSGTKAPVLGTGAYTYEAIHDWGELPARIKWGNTHGVVEDSQGNIYVHHTVHATSDSADSMVVFDSKGKFVRSWGKEFRGVAHGLHIRKEGRDEFLYLTVNAANPQDDAAARDAGRGRQGDAERGDRLEDSGAAGRRGLPARRRTARRSATTRPTSRSRPTATSTSATATARPTSTSTTARRSTSAPSAAGDPSRASSPSRTASGWTCARRKPMLVVADRRNNRLQRFTLDGTARGFRRRGSGCRAISTSTRARSSFPICTAASR